MEMYIKTFRFLLYMSKSILIESGIKEKIHTIRDVQVILDEDLAELYDVETKALNQAVKRNSTRFPERFMFQLTEKEFEQLRSQIATSKQLEERSLRSQIVTLKTSRGEHRKYLPYAFTEQGVAMLSGVLKSETAINVSIQIMDAFVSMRKFIAENGDIFFRLKQRNLTKFIFQSGGILRHPAKFRPRKINLSGETCKVSEPLNSC